MVVQNKEAASRESAAAATPTDSRTTGWLAAPQSLKRWLRRRFANSQICLFANGRRRAAGPALALADVIPSPSSPPPFPPARAIYLGGPTDRPRAARPARRCKIDERAAQHASHVGSSRPRQRRQRRCRSRLSGVQIFCTLWPWTGWIERCLRRRATG